MNRIRLSFGVCVALGLSCLPPVMAQGVSAGRYRISLFATPQRVPADGHSISSVRIELQDGSGNLVTNDTQIIVHTDLGLISTTGTDRSTSADIRTQGGYAVVQVISDSVGTATVSAQVTDSRNQTTIDFLPPGQSTEPESRVVDIKGGWVGYAPDLGLIEARDRAQVTLGHLKIEVGDIVQIDTKALTIKAQSVIVKRDGKELRGEDLYLDISAKKGVVRLLGKSGIERVTFSLYSVEPSAQEFTPPPDAFHLAAGDTDTWMVASGVSFFIGEKICLRHAGLFIQGQKVFGFPPLWVLAMPGYSGSSNSQIIGVSSSGGIAVDMPFFYSVTDSTSGAIKVQKGTSAGSVIAREGWSLALQEEYRTPRQCNGTFTIDGLPQKDWGVSWRDTRPLFGDSQASFDVGMPDHRSLFADANIYRFETSHRFSFRANLQDPTGSDATYGFDADWLTNPRRISPAMSYSLGTTLGLHRGALPTNSSTLETGTYFQNQMFAGLNFTPWNLSHRTTLTPSITNTFLWTTADTRTNSARGQLVLDQVFGSTCGASLSYAAEAISGTAAASTTTQSGLQQMLTLDFRADRGKWDTYWNASRDITNDTDYAMVTFDYSPKRDWRVGLTKSYYTFGTESFNDLETTLARKVGDREFGVTFSTATGKVWLQLGGFTMF